MAQAMAAAAAHSMPPFPLPALPRIRPPPIPKGTPGPNTILKPNVPPPNGKAVWADGKWVQPYDNAAKHRRKVISTQLEKALQHEVRGMNIYAYRNRLTSQVVYSLTKNMDNHKIMKQMLFHGKKTVPSALRRDHWAPYFSVHFPKTPDGASKGMQVFQHLRELSLRRQLDPPKYVKLSDEQYLTEFKEEADNNLIALLNRRRTGRGARHRIVDLPVPGQPVARKTLSNRLRNQLGSSVADLAAVLTLLAPNGGGIKSSEGSKQAKSIEGAPVDQLDMTEQSFTQELTGKDEQNEIALMSLSDRAFKRIQSIRKEEEKRMRQVIARKTYLQEEAGHVKLDKHTLDRLSMEYEGSIGTPGLFPTTFDMIDAKHQAEESSIALEQLQKDIHAEKLAKRQEIENVEAARIDRKLAEKSAEERQTIENTIQAQKNEITTMVDTEITKTRELLKQYRDQARNLRAVSEDAKTIAANNRIFVREMNQYLLQKKSYLMARYAMWCGPYAEIPAHVEDAMAVIDTSYQDRIAELTERVQAEIENKLKRNAEGVLVRWANPQDGQYAESWPESVLHGELEAKAVVLKKALVVRQHAHLDANEDMVDEQKAVIAVPRSNSAHVFGAEENIDNRYQGPEKLSKTMQEARKQRIEEHVHTARVRARDKIVALGILRDDLSQELDYFELELKNAIKAKVDSVIAQFETDMGILSYYRHDYQYKDWVQEQFNNIPRFQNELVSTVQKALSSISPEGEILEDSRSVMDTTVSARAKELATQLADVRTELAIFGINHYNIKDDVERYREHTNLFKERANLAQLYPAAEEWLAQEQSILQRTENETESQTGSKSAPEGLNDLQEFESQYAFIGDAMQRARINTGIELDDTPTQRVALLNKKIIDLTQKRAAALARPAVKNSKTTKLRAEEVADLRDQITSLREDRVKAIQHNNPAFDKQAWREHEQKERGIVADRVEAKQQEEDAAAKRAAEALEATRKEKEEPAATGLMDRVRGLFSRR